MIAYKKQITKIHLKVCTYIFDDLWTIEKTRSLQAFQKLNFYPNIEIWDMGCLGCLIEALTS